jgi:hypothetical protein
MKGGSDRLDSEQEKELREHLTMQRLAFCRDRANEIGVYLSKETLDPPRYVNTQKPSLEEMFTWQWRVWVLSRITAAIGEINGDSAEPQAPIHSVDQISVRGLMDVNTPAAGARSFGSGSGGSGGGGRPGGGLGGGPSGGGVGGVSVPKAKTRDYSRSVTGRITNEKFDVVLVDLDMVVSLERLDEVLEGFSTPMALSVLDLEVSRVDAFDALGRGEYFGESPVARLVVTVETLWLREWSREFMPDQTRMRIGIAPRAANEGDSGGSF